MAQVFAPQANTIARAVLLCSALLAAGALALLITLPFTMHVTAQDVIVEQPIQFSHKHHSGGLGIGCRYCHTSVEQSRFAGVPPTHTCMSCHSQIWTNTVTLASVRESLARNEPIRWRRVNVLPDYAFFDHSVHVTNGVGCSTCHGVISRMPQVRQTAPLTMGWCLDCHRDPAPSLRTEAEIYDMNWTPPADQRTRGPQLMAHYGIRTEHLAECSVCHR